jgi:hypothetical protein
MPIPYSTFGNVTASLFSGSFLNEQDTTLFLVSQSIDFWFGLSSNDVIEFAAYNPADDSLIAWTTLDQDKSFTTNTLTFLDSLNIPQSFNYRTLDNPFTLYKNSKLLVNPINDLSSSGIIGGSFRVSYAFTRDMAGSPQVPLSIKDISPSRTEIKLITQGAGTIQYEAFCRKKFPTRDVAPLLISITQKCPYDQIFAIQSKLPEYKAGLDFLKFVFFLPDDGSVVTFLKDLYEDFIKYTSLSQSQIDVGLEPTRITRIQGIRSYFSNYLLTSFDSINDFDAIEKKFGQFVNVRLDQRFGQFTTSQSKEYKASRQFCYDFFFKFFYESFVHPLQSSYQQKYFSHLKNVLNFGNNRYFTILDHDFLDERTNPSDPLTLLVKLSAALPNDIASKDNCWVSNFGMTPFVLTVVLQNPSLFHTIRISPANFGATSQFITPENVNKLYSQEDLSMEIQQKDDVTINKNIATLNTDFSNFQNFVVFSSINTRLSIFETKVKTWAALSASSVALDVKYSGSLSTATVYPYYFTEKALVQDQMTGLVNSFDSYESHLFSSGLYSYSIASSSFVSSSYVISQRELAQTYDKNNRDNLVSNTPEYILNDPGNEEYLTFLQMCGHHFDNIYTYISALPIERQVKNELSSSIPISTLKQMLSSAGWNVDDIIGSLNIDEVYLNSLNSPTYNILSAEQRLQIIWNRLLVNLPGIYKSKGTEECVRLLLSCYGLPSSLITIREYGGTDFSEEPLPTYKLDEKTFLAKFSGVSDYIEGPTPRSAKTIEFKFSVENPDGYVNRIYYPLFENIPYPNTDPTQNAWSVGLVKVPGQFTGQIEFRMESGSTGTKITSSVIPLFNGDIFSVMVRRNYTNADFDSSTDTNVIPRTYDLVVQRNEDGRKVFYSTSSAILLQQDNAVFAQYGRFRLGNGRAGGQFVGTLDKLSIWDVPIDNSSWEEHVNDINSYGLSGSLVDQNLWVRLGVDYPLNLYQNLNGSSSVWMDNQSPYYAIPNYYIGGLSGSINSSSLAAATNIISTRWHPFYPTGSVEIIVRNFPKVIGSAFTASFNYSTCSWDSGSVFPFHYRELTYQQDIDASKYGPNKFKNKKIRKVNYEIESRFDVEDKSTNLIKQTVSGESNQIGFFIDPQDHKNKDIIRYVGRSGIMDLIGDPSNIFSDRYYDLINKNEEYNSVGNKQTLFNELLTLYKFYFDKSIFQAIKNVLPARANVFTGVVIEPTILERPKYQNRPISSSIMRNDYISDIQPITFFGAQGLWINDNFNFTINGAQSMTTQSMQSLINSMPPNYFTEINLGAVNNPNVIYPDNLNWDYLNDSLDKIQLSHYADFENYPRLWESIGAPPGWPIDPIIGTTSQQDFDDLFVIGPDQNAVLKTNDPTSTGWNQGSHSIVYYLMKVWEKYSYYYKTGPYFHTDTPSENTYASNSVYLYRYVAVAEPFMRRYVYWYDLKSNLIPNTDPSYTWNGSQYLHKTSTFIGTPDQNVSNVYATGMQWYAPTTFTLNFRNDNQYFEIVSGYPRNHYTHKLELFSKTQHARFVDSNTNAIYKKGRNTINTTISTTGIEDGTFPVQSFNTSNVNVVNSTNVLQTGGGGVVSSGGGVVVPSGGGTSIGGGTGTTGGTSTPPSAGGTSGGSNGCLIAGTQIMMADGTIKNVEDITVGDLVWGYGYSSVSVLELKPGRWNEYYIINNRLKITWEHPVMLNTGFLVMVRDLKIGDRMVRYNGATEEITSIITVKGETPTYNFITNNNHLYIADGIVVHNPTVQKF